MPDRTLWTAVLLQVADDIEADRNSLEYREAVAFVTSPGPYWAESRGNVASHLDMHVDDIQRAGRRWIAEREARDPAPAPVVVTRPARKPLPLRPPMRLKPIAKTSYTKRRFVFDPDAPILRCAPLISPLRPRPYAE